MEKNTRCALENDDLLEEILSFTTNMNSFLLCKRWNRICIRNFCIGCIRFFPKAKKYIHCSTCIPKFDKFYPLYECLDYENFTPVLLWNDGSCSSKTECINKQQTLKIHYKGPFKEKKYNIDLLIKKLDNCVTDTMSGMTRISVDIDGRKYILCILYNAIDSEKYTETPVFLGVTKYEYRASYFASNYNYKFLQYSVKKD